MATRKSGSRAQQPKTSEPMPDRSWERRRDWFQARLREQPPPGLGADELQAHFAGMPPHYWEQVDEADLRWGLAAVHGFLKLVTASNAPATRPYMDSRPTQPAAGTQVMLCTWDRLGLLAKAAAALSELRLNILGTEAFARSDDVVLIVFTVVDVETGGPASPERLKEVHFLLEGALSEPPRFASLWMCSRHKYVVPASQTPPRIRFDNAASGSATLVHIEATDRLGLLYDILHTLAGAGLDVAEAHIKTENQLARDVVHVRDADGQKVVSAEQLEELRSKLTAALTMKS